MTRAIDRKPSYRRLTEGYLALPVTASSEERWRWLMAAHVVGQRRLDTHVDSHLRMLALAWATRDGGEMAGQLWRLALVPLGHALGRLPAGNVGRATVPALRAMTPPDDVLALVHLAASQPGDSYASGG